MDVHNPTVGYWGVPGFSTVTKTHIRWNGKPFCGSHMLRAAKFQICAPLSLTPPECARCRSLWALHHATP